MERRSVVGTSGASGSSSSYTKAVRLGRGEGPGRAGRDKVVRVECGVAQRQKEANSAVPTPLRGCWQACSALQSLPPPPAVLLGANCRPRPRTHLGRKSSATGTPGPRCLGSKKKACTARPSGVWKVSGCTQEAGGRGARSRRKRVRSGGAGALACARVKGGWQAGGLCPVCSRAC